MKVPKYVQELVELGRLRPAPLDEQANESEKNENAVYGYIFRLYRLSNTQYLSTLMDEACRLMGWAHREYADAKILFSLPSDGGKRLDYDAIHKSVKLFKNGRVDIKFRSVAYVQEFVEACLRRKVA